MSNRPKKLTVKTISELRDYARSFPNTIELGKCGNADICFDPETKRFSLVRYEPPPARKSIYDPKTGEWTVRYY